MQPNVLVVLVDSLRADRCWPSERECRTPVLDEFSASATLFPKAFSTASMTTVSVASLLTGTYPIVHGVHSLSGRRLRPDLETLAEVFAQNGYHTWAEVTGPLESMTGLDRGFDDYRHRNYRDWLDTSFASSLVAHFKSERRPWFGFVHLWEIHYPRRVVGPYNRRSRYGRSLYDRAVSSLDSQLGPVLRTLDDDPVVVLTGDHGEFLSTSRRAELATRLKAVTPWLKKRLPLAKKLRRHLVPLLMGGATGSSRGENEVYRAWLGHGFHVYDPLVHVPLVMRGGVFPAGQEVPDLVSHVDVFPTLVSALGLESEGSMVRSGVNLMPLVQGSGRIDREGVYLQASGARRMSRPEQWLAGVRSPRYKYVRGLFNDTLPEELYDLENDPGEQANVAGSLPTQAAEMRRLLTSIIEADGSLPAVDSETAYSPEEQAELEERLAELGYMD